MLSIAITRFASMAILTKHFSIIEFVTTIYALVMNFQVLGIRATCHSLYILK